MLSELTFSLVFVLLFAQVVDVADTQIPAKGAFVVLSSEDAAPATNKRISFGCFH